MSHSARLTAVRADLRDQGLAGFLVPRADEHLGEYVPESAERLAWLTGFTGSAGIAAVLADEAAVWSDGRYVLQLAAETDATLWQRLHIQETPPPEWLAPRLGAGELGYDPWLMSEDQLKPYREANLRLRAVTRNPVDAAWADRPPAPLAPALPHRLENAGEPSEAKRAAVAATLRARNEDAAVISDPASLAWLLNIRGQDVPYTPFALGFALVRADGAVDLFMAPEKLPPETRAWIGNSVAMAPPAALPAALTALKGLRVRVDPVNTAAWFAERLRAAGAEVVAGADPCLALKARKNAVEQEGARRAHLRDAVAMARFLHWLTTAAGKTDELAAADQLLAFRREGEGNRGASFATIMGAGPNGAIIHYHATPETNRRVQPNETLLIDSGGQYPDGTTDITRTVWMGPDAPPAELRDRFTRVLKGHIAIATLVFPENTPGVRIDAFARAALWQAGLDYDHGTGHGVGSYLSVHEGPASISPYLRPAGLTEGMIMSNEPGFYLPGHYGIRIENLVLARRAETAGPKPFLCFETLSLAPIERRLIDPALLTASERTWIDTYHARVAAEVAPLAPPETAAWLREVCAPL